MCQNCFWKINHDLENRKLILERRGQRLFNNLIIILDTTINYTEYMWHFLYLVFSIGSKKKKNEGKCLVTPFAGDNNSLPTVSQYIL